MAPHRHGFTLPSITAALLQNKIAIEPAAVEPSSQNAASTQIEGNQAFIEIAGLTPQNTEIRNQAVNGVVSDVAKFLQCVPTCSTTSKARGHRRNTISQAS